jgi:macrodomain Ter protein organizer (MatP/YcbG family)
MARPKYTITASDLNHAYFYLSDRLLTRRVRFDDSVSPDAADRAFREAMVEKGKEKQSARLNAWCERYLSSSEWAKLKLAIRKRRERFNRHDELKSITISAKAFAILSKVSKRDAVSYSEALECYLSKALRGTVQGKRQRG